MKIQKFNEKSRSKEEIDFAIKAIEKDLETAPATSMFGDDNHKIIRLGLDLLNGDIDEDDLYDMEDDQELDTSETQSILSYQEFKDGQTELEDILYNPDLLDDMKEESEKTNEINLCPKICGECPFSNKSMKGFLADYDKDDFIQMMNQEVSFPCHMRMTEEGGTPEEMKELIEKGEITICRGYVESLIKSAKMPRSNKQLMDAIEKVREDGLNDNTMAIWDFIKHHTINNI